MMPRRSWLPFRRVRVKRLLLLGSHEGGRQGRRGLGHGPAPRAREALSVPGALVRMPNTEAASLPLPGKFGQDEVATAG